MRASKTPVSRLRTFLVDNPWWAFAGAVSGIIAIPLAIYLYVAGKEAPDVRYYVNPVRAVIAKAGVNSDLSILYNHQPISDDVTSVSIAVWNAGTKPVTASDVLAPLQIAIAPGHGILEAKLVSATRSVVALQLDTSKLSDGVVGLQFRILEHNDGGIVQLLYRGDPAVKIDAQGSIIGQSSLTPVVYTGRLQSATDQIRSNKRFAWLELFLVLSLGIFGTTAMIRTKRLEIGIVLAVVFLVGMVMYIWYSEVPPTPPFEFR